MNILSSSWRFQVQDFPPGRWKSHGIHLDALDFRRLWATWMSWLCGNFHTTRCFKRLTAHRARTALLPARHGPPGLEEGTAGKGCRKQRKFRDCQIPCCYLKKPTACCRCLFIPRKHSWETSVQKMLLPSSN